MIPESTRAVLQEWYIAGFGADADQLKAFADIDCMMQVSFTMYTIDPSDHVDDRVIAVEKK